MLSQPLSQVRFDTPFHHVETPIVMRAALFWHGEVCNHAPTVQAQAPHTRPSRLRNQQINVGVAVGTSTAYICGVPYPLGSTETNRILSARESAATLSSDSSSRAPPALKRAAPKSRRLLRSSLLRPGRTSLLSSIN